MSDHLLIRLAHRFPVGPIQPITGWRYRRDIGAWVDSDAPEALFADGAAFADASPPKPPLPPQPSPQPPPPKPRPPMSKKADIETGEDMKGE